MTSCQVAVLISLSMPARIRTTKVEGATWVGETGSAPCWGRILTETDGWWPDWNYQHGSSITGSRGIISLKTMVLLMVLRLRTMVKVVR